MMINVVPLALTGADRYALCITHLRTTPHLRAGLLRYRTFGTLFFPSYNIHISFCVIMLYSLNLKPEKHEKSIFIPRMYRHAVLFL